MDNLITGPNAMYWIGGAGGLEVLGVPADAQPSAPQDRHDRLDLRVGNVRVRKGNLLNLQAVFLPYDDHTGRCSWLA